MSPLVKFLLTRFRRELIVLLLVSGVINLLMLLPTVYMFQIFDRIMISKSELTLLFVSMIVLALYGLQALGEYIRARLASAIGIRIDQALSPLVFDAIFKDRLHTANSNPLQAFSDLSSIRMWVSGQGLFGFLDGPWAPFYLVIIFLLHPLLGWLAVCFLCVLIGLTIYTTKKTRMLSDQSVEEERELNKFLYTKLRNAEVLEAHGMVPSLQRRWWERQVGFLKGQSYVEDVEERFTSGTKQVRFLLNSLALGAGALLAIHGEITMISMVAASLLMGRTTAPLDAVMGSWKSFQMARSAVERIEVLLSANATSREQGTQRSTLGGIRVKHLSASLISSKDTEPITILRDIDFTCESGSITVLMGPSGAGKTTLAKCLVGIWPELQGELWFGEHEVQSLDRQSFGRSLGYLPQDVELFRGTVAENIARMAAPDSEMVVKAAKAVGLHEFILKLPQGYDTVIGEMGGYLSGGQRQRLALARVLYGEPQFIVLDEPNASLDDQGERALQSALLGAKSQGATIILISHRPSALALADRVILLKSGSVTFNGSRDAFRAVLTRQNQSNGELKL